MLPFALSVAIASVSPFPSKVCLPTSPKGPANGGGAPAGRIVPVAVYPKLLCRVAFEHPFSPALAVGATARARAITAAMVRDFVTVLPFMVISFVFIKWRSLRDNPSVLCVRGPSGTANQRTMPRPIKTCARTGQVLFSDCPWVRTLAHRKEFGAPSRRTGRVQRGAVILLPSHATVNGTGVLMAHTSSSQPYRLQHPHPRRGYTTDRTCIGCRGPIAQTEA